MQFRVRSLDTAARTVLEEQVDANSAEEARSRMVSSSRVVLSVEQAVVRRAGLQGLLRPGPRALARPRPRKASEVAVLCRELQALTHAGLTIVEALEALASMRTGRQAASGAPSLGPHSALLQRLRAGRTLSDAFTDVGGFSPLLVAAIRSGERTSNLAEGLASYLRFDDLMGALKRRVVSAALYPGIVLSMGAVITLFLLWVVIPRFAVLYGQMDAGMSAATRALLTVSQWLQAAPWAVPVAAFIVAALGWISIKALGGWQGLMLGLVDRIPGLQRQRREFELARCFAALALLTRGGYTLHEALALSAAVGLSTRTASALQLARDAIGRGQSPSAAFDLAGLTDGVTQRLLRAGERGGDFAGLLDAVGQRHAQVFETFVERATRVIEPLLLLIVALVVGGTVVVLYMPVFDVASTVR